jgi:N-methylhydantoinase A/oxoprolinase/acetone carboxylase beta subunit
MALERPVETILSGPAASVAGARYLTSCRNAIVVDIGGTTTDTAVLQQGTVKVCGEGSDVSGFKTHVKALEIRTSGLGGDSYIFRNQRDYQIGPNRVAPVAWLGTKEPHIDQVFTWIRRSIDLYKGSTRPLQILTRTATVDGLPLNAQERDIIKLLRERPFSLQELAERMDTLHCDFLPLARLEENHIIQRCGLTPTDLLNATGGFNLWDQKSSQEMCAIFSEISGINMEELVENLLNEVVKNLALEVLKKQLDEDTDPDALQNCDVCRVLFDNLLNRGGRNYSVRIKMHQPIIGVGAPAHYFLTRAGSLLDAEIILPEHADVANAVGAITSNIRVRRQLQIKPSTLGGFMIEGIAGAKRFPGLEQAADYAERELIRMVRETAHASGTSEMTVEVDVKDHVPQSSEGQQVFLGRTVTAQLTGRPDLPTELANREEQHHP